MSKLNENKMRNEIMMLALDMINNAKSGHPGIVLSSGTIMYTLFESKTPIVRPHLLKSLFATRGG